MSLDHAPTNQHNIACSARAQCWPDRVSVPSSDLELVVAVVVAAVVVAPAPAGADVPGFVAVAAAAVVYFLVAVGVIPVAEARLGFVAPDAVAVVVVVVDRGARVLVARSRFVGESRSGLVAQPTPAREGSETERQKTQYRKQKWHEKW